MSAPPAHVFGPFRFDIEDARLTRHGAVVHLTPKALAVLAMLVRRPRHLVSKDELMAGVWPEAIVEEANLAVQISALRKALDTGDGVEYIETVPKRGYRFAADVQVVAPDEAAPPTPFAIAAPAVPRRRLPIWIACAALMAAGVGATTLWKSPATPPDPQVREQYERAREMFAQRTPDAIRAAIRLYEDVIARQPAYAPAHAGLADAYAVTASGLPPATRLRLAKPAALRAIELDETLAAGHNSLAFVTYKFEWNWELAERSFRRSVALDPTYVLARHWFGEFLDILGRYDEAVEQLAIAHTLDPFSVAVRSDYQAVLVHAGRVAEARAVVEESVRRDPASPRAFQGLANVLTAEGRYDEAFEADVQARLLAGEAADRIDAMRAAYRAGGRMAVLRLQNERLRGQLEANAANLPFGLATSLAFNSVSLEEWDEALHWLEAAADRGEDGPLKLNQLAIHEPLRTTTRFQLLLRRVGLDRQSPAPAAR